VQCRTNEMVADALTKNVPAPAFEQLWRGAGGGSVLAGTRRPSAAGDGVPPSLQIPPLTHILFARSPAPYSPFRRRAHSPTAFSGQMARPPPSPPRPPPSHMHAGLSRLTLYVGVVECAPASLPPASSSLTHARRMDGFCNQNADQLGSLAGLSLLTVYVGVVECAPASPYTYSSSTHRFPDERTPIEATPLSATSAELGLGLGLGLGLDSLSHSSSHALPFFSPPSFHTLAFSPAFTSVWWSA
jgi:hypothetical protein